jgi:hypothetical protein
MCHYRTSLARLRKALMSEVDPDFGTRGLIGKAAAPLLNGADHDETSETED